MNMDTKLTSFYHAFGEGDGLFYMGHASVLCVFGGRKILFDPVILSQPYGDSWTFFPAQIVDPRVYEVDAVVVSHIHQDHYDVRFLQALSARTKVIVVGGRPSFENDLKANGIANLHIVEPETVVEILDGVFFFGVAHETNGIDSSAIVFNERFCIYHGNDNYLKPASMEKFRKVRPNIDVACIPYAYIHWYPFLLEYDADQSAEKKAEGERLVRMYMDDCIRATRILDPKVVIPFGANLLLDDGNCYSEINLAVKTPIEFCDYARECDQALGKVVRPMLAGDYCGLDGGELNTTIAHVYESDEYRALANEFLEARPAKQDGRQWQPLERAGFLAALNEKLKNIEDGIDEVIRIEARYLGETVNVQIDCGTRRAAFVDAFTGTTGYHHFKLDPIASGEWLNGKRLEEIIGMRRFTLKRVPNVYNPAVLRMTSTVL